jgi:hypothetical protein
MLEKKLKGESRIDISETLATLGRQDTEWREIKQ